jgi:arylformamidase
MKIIDVTLALRSDMPTWPGEPGPRITPHSQIAEGKPANVSILTFANHTGTHVDPPLHMLADGYGVDELPLEALLGPARVIGYESAAHISGQWLDRQRIPRTVTRFVFRTLNSDLWRAPNREFRKDFVALDETAGQWLADHGAVLVGVDYLSVEPFGSSPKGHPVHKTLLRRGAVIIEGLDLHQVEPGDYEIVCLPLKVLRGDGAPARVVLIER